MSLDTERLLDHLDRVARTANLGASTGRGGGVSNYAKDLARSIRAGTYDEVHPSPPCDCPCHFLVGFSHINACCNQPPLSETIT